MTTSRIYAYRWPARLVSHKPFAAESYSITPSCIWQVFFRKKNEFSFLFSPFCQRAHFLCKMHNPQAFLPVENSAAPAAQCLVWAVLSLLYIYNKMSNLSCAVNSEGTSNDIAFEIFASFTPYSFDKRSNISSFTYLLSFTSPYVQPFNAFFNSYFLFFLLFNSSSERPISYKFTFVISSSLLFTNSCIFSNVYVLSSIFIVFSVGASFFFFM